MLFSSTDIPCDYLGARRAGDRRKGERRKQSRAEPDRRGRERRLGVSRCVLPRPSTRGAPEPSSRLSLSLIALLLLVPLSLALAAMHAAPLWLFAVGAAAIIPLGEWIRRATEQVAERAGPAIGGLLNVTFGNAAEFILALFVLRSGNTGVVKATITGSIIGNSLLGLGMAILAGSWGREKQTFKRERAGLLASLLILSVIALLLPALFDYTERGLVLGARAHLLDERLSLGVSVVLILVYAGNLFYTLVTHRDVFASADEEGSADVVADEGADGARRRDGRGRRRGGARLERARTDGAASRPLALLSSASSCCRWSATPRSTRRRSTSRAATAWVS